MRTLFVACMLLLFSSRVGWAHPAVGIVMDSKGNVFYTDPVHVWRIGLNGQKSIVVRDVHTHELAIDSADNIFGEDSEYLGGDRYRHRIWRRSSTGNITDVIPWRNGFWREYGFTRDQAGTMYWVSCPEQICVIRKRPLHGQPSNVTSSVRFNNSINWIAAGVDGSLYVVDGNDLRRLEKNGQINTAAANLGTVLMGLWLDAASNVYVASWKARVVQRVRPDGRVTTVVRSPEPWGPSGVLVAPDSAIWVLETSTTNAVRVRRIAKTGKSTIYSERTGVSQRPLLTTALTAVVRLDRKF